MRIDVKQLGLVLVSLACLLYAAMLCSGCNDNSTRATRVRVDKRLVENARDDAAVLIETIASALNGLPNEVVLELTPPRPILDDSKSTDGKEVLATCNVTPAVPDGPFNYLHVPQGNVDLRKLQIQPGDIVRYFVAADQQSSELDIRQQTYLELPVRRLDVNDPQHALILDVDLGVPVLIPERIEIWRFSDKRMNEIRFRLRRYIEQRRPAIDWEPSPDESALRQLTDRLNQWLRTVADNQLAWQGEPLLEQLPAHLREAKPLEPFVSPAALEDESFHAFESRELQQAVWLRDIASWAKGDALSDLDVAARLFDWTVRNIQLDEPGDAAVVHRPWQALMYGHGTAEQRAWVFAELCRQQQLDVVILGIGVADGQEQSAPRAWLPALWSEGKLYLFDTRLGLPIPGQGASEVATLAEVAADPALLERLNVDDQHIYPIGTDELKRVEAWLVASPLQLSRRAAQLQQALEGDNFVVLSADHRHLEQPLRDDPLITAVGLWPQPWEAMLEEQSMQSADRLAAAQHFLVFAQRPRLWKARVLHFQGTKLPPLHLRDDPLIEPSYGHQEATRFYHDRHIRPPEKVLESLEPARQVVYRRAKGDASFWLGLLSYDRGNYEVAVDWLSKRTLEATPDGPWTASARYNLARTYEALGKFAEAIELLEADNSPQRHGNLLRARSLRQHSSDGKASSDEDLQ